MDNELKRELLNLTAKGREDATIRILVKYIDGQDKRIEVLEQKVAQLFFDAQPLKSKYDIPDNPNY